MDKFLHKIYLEEAKDECEKCFIVLKAFNEAVRAENTRADQLFSYLHVFVHHTAALSHIFWPPGGKNSQQRKRSQTRGSHLRNLLKIETNHPIQNRTLRDHFEHFDERLDDWAEKSVNKNYGKKFIWAKISNWRKCNIRS